MSDPRYWCPNCEHCKEEEAYIASQEAEREADEQARCQQAQYEAEQQRADEERAREEVQP